MKYAVSATKGDLNQRSAQFELLTSHDIPHVPYKEAALATIETKTDYVNFLKLVWSTKCPGYWHYQKDLFESGICKPYAFYSSVSGSGNVRLYHMITLDELKTGTVTVNDEPVTDAKHILHIGDTIKTCDRHIVVE